MENSDVKPYSFFTGLQPRTNVPRYKVNLDDSPEKRWTEIVRDYKPKLQQVQKVLLQMVQEILGEIKGSIFKGFASSFFGLLNKMGVVYFNEELNAIAKEAELSLGDLVLLQLSYEMFATCTSIVVHDSQGNPLHCRSMDWDLKILTDLTIEVEFYKSNSLQFVATTWAGYVGVLTGLRHGSYSLSINFRRTDQGTVFNNIKNSIAGGWPIGFLVRVVLEQDTTYSRAKHSLSHSLLIAPCYIILAGINPGEGVIITRNRESPDNLCELQENKVLVQTNRDQWSEDPEDNIIWSIQRIELVESCLKELRLKKIDVDVNIMGDIYKIHPVKNEETIYNSFMRPADSFYVSYVV